MKSNQLNERWKITTIKYEYFKLGRCVSIYSYNKWTNCIDNFILLNFSELASSLCVPALPQLLNNNVSIFEACHKWKIVFAIFLLNTGGVFLILISRSKLQTILFTKTRFLLHCNRIKCFETQRFLQQEINQIFTPIIIYKMLHNKVIVACYYRDIRKQSFSL